MASFVAVYDACVLYPAALRDLLVRLGMTGLFRARWSREIADEWCAALLRDRPDIPEAQLRRTQALMEKAVPDALPSTLMTSCRTCSTSIRRESVRLCGTNAWRW